MHEGQGTKSFIWLPVLFFIVQMGTTAAEDNDENRPGTLLLPDGTVVVDRPSSPRNQAPLLVKRILGQNATDSFFLRPEAGSFSFRFSHCQNYDDIADKAAGVDIAAMYADYRSNAGGNLAVSITLFFSENYAPLDSLYDTFRSLGMREEDSIEGGKPCFIEITVPATKGADAEQKNTVLVLSNKSGISTIGWTSAALPSKAAGGCPLDETL